MKARAARCAREDYCGAVPLATKPAASGGADPG